MLNLPWLLIMWSFHPDCPPLLSLPTNLLSLQVCIKLAFDKHCLYSPGGGNLDVSFESDTDSVIVRGRHGSLELWHSFGDPTGKPAVGELESIGKVDVQGEARPVKIHWPTCHPAQVGGGPERQEAWSYFLSKPGQA